MRLFKRTEGKNIPLYCQNPQCGSPLISLGDEVANIQGSLVHINRECMLVYMAQKMSESSDEVMAVPSIPYVSYTEAEKLARKGAVKFNKLETEASN